MEIFLKNNQKNNVCRNNLDDFLGMCDPPDVEPDDISEANSQNYFAIGVVEDEEDIENPQLLTPTMKFLNLELKLHMMDEIMNLLYQKVIYFVELHIYWLGNVMNFMDPSQKNTLSRVSVLQKKALYSH